MKEERRHPSLLLRGLALLLLASIPLAFLLCFHGGPFMAGCFGKEENTYFALINGRVYTVDPDLPRVEAFAFLDGRIIDLGSSQEILKRHPQAKVMDVKGRTVIPGLIDAHAHLMNQAKLTLQADLSGSKSVEEVVDRLEAFVAENPVAEGGWIMARGWDQNLWGGEFPTKEDLDGAFPDTPVYLRRVDGHACWVNSAALRAIPPLPLEDPEGGLIIRDEAGEPTGVFIDNAMWLVEDHMPPYPEEELLRGIEEAVTHCNSLGLTGIHDAGVPKEDLEVFKKAIDQGRFSLRNYAFLGCRNGVYFCPEDSPIIIDYGNRLTVRSVKIYLDGALGSWGAAMIEPYSDKPDSTGLLRMDPDELEPAFRKWVSLGYQVNTHCIGDLANRLTIDAYEKVIREVGLDKDLRLRVEHAQIIAPEDIPRFAPLNIIPSFQPIHATSDMLYAEDRIGPERILGAYAWQTLAQTGARLPLGSDFPVEKVNPFLGLYAAVTRQDLNGLPSEGWYPHERLTMEQALKGFTLDAAFAAFQEDQIGSISVGKWADFVVIDRDLFEIKPSDIPGTQVLATFLAGKPVFEASSGPSED